jgi:hypothetical protein
MQQSRLVANLVANHTLPRSGMARVDAITRANAQNSVFDGDRDIAEWLSGYISQQQQQQQQQHQQMHGNDASALANWVGAIEVALSQPQAPLVVPLDELQYEHSLERANITLHEQGLEATMPDMSLGTDVMPEYGGAMDAPLFLPSPDMESLLLPTTAPQANATGTEWYDEPPPTRVTNRKRRKIHVDAHVSISAVVYSRWIDDPSSTTINRPQVRTRKRPLESYFTQPCANTRICSELLDTWNRITTLAASTVPRRQTFVQPPNAASARFVPQPLVQHQVPEVVDIDRQSQNQHHQQHGTLAIGNVGTMVHQRAIDVGGTNLQLPPVDRSIALLDDSEADFMLPSVHEFDHDGYALPSVRASLQSRSSAVDALHPTATPPSTTSFDAQALQFRNERHTDAQQALGEIEHMRHHVEHASPSISRALPDSPQFYTPELPDLYQRRSSFATPHSMLERSSIRSTSRYA